MHPRSFPNCPMHAFGDSVGVRRRCHRACVTSHTSRALLGGRDPTRANPPLRRPPRCPFHPDISRTSSAPRMPSLRAQVKAPEPKSAKKNNYKTMQTALNPCAAVRPAWISELQTARRRAQTSRNTQTRATVHQRHSSSPNAALASCRSTDHTCRGHPDDITF